MRRVSRCARSAAGWVLPRLRCGPMLWLRGGGVRSPPGIGAGCGSRLGSGRRSHAGSLEASRCDVLPAGWVARRRRCHVKWLATAAGRHIGLRLRIRRLGAVPIDRNRPSSPAIHSSVRWWKPSSGCGGHRYRSPAGSWRHILAMRRCGCHTRRSTNHCSSRAKALCVRNSGGACEP